MRDLIDSDPAKAIEQIGLTLRLVGDALADPPTVGHAIRISSATADLVVLTASHAAWSSNARVNRAL